MAKTKLSGFPEFLPGERIVERRVLRSLSRTFELHGFASIETRALEPMASLARKGEIDKEVYVVRRIHAAEGEPAEFGLHFDLTVPFARYVLENAGFLEFPFRRYQIQKAWRGERPQEGRFREFLQADVDIVGQGELAAHHDIELPLVMLDALGRLHDDFGIPQVKMRVNNRKLSEGFYRGLGVDDPMAVLQRVDKLDKVGPEVVAKLLVDDLGMSAAAADACLALAKIKTEDTSFVEQVRALGVENELLDQGLSELATVVEAIAEQAPGRIVADLSVARGLDYYTGTVYETEMETLEHLGSICSGGRYDSLASDGKHTYPGVGLSIGVSRILVPLLNKGILHSSRVVPTCVLVAVDNEQTRRDSIRIATRLRERGISAEVAPAASKYGKQIKYADRRGIPFVWFGNSVKDIRSGEQVEADPLTWTPPSADLEPAVKAVGVVE
ncbi:MAG: histidine--tRNA ligase [Propionibacteriaceae bacterium]|jgi:histidyl-tRNA synthetase|nr:histidine--tRNA ligase [Propionibacteriaceae bacterium]